MTIKNKDFIFYLLLILPGLFFFSIHFYYSVNIPSYNEYQNCFETILNFKTCKDIPCKLGILFSNDSEHRDFFPKLYNLIITKLNGSIDLRYMMVLGHAGLLLFALLIFKQFKEEQVSIIKFLPFCLLIFQPQYYRTSFNGFDTCLHFHVLMWAGLSFYFALKTGWYNFVLSIICTLLSCYSNGNGIVALPIVSFLFFWQKRWKPFGISLLILLSNLFLYFHNFYLPSHLTGVDFNWMKIIQAIFLLIGSHFVFEFLAISFGIFIFLLFLLLCFLFSKHEYNSLPKPQTYFFFALLLFIFASICMIAIKRYIFGIEALLSSRYTLYSVLFSGVLYLLIVKIINLKYQKIFFQIAVLFSLTFFILSWGRDLKSIHWTRKTLVSGIKEWNQTGEGLAYADSVDCEVMQKSLKEGIYKIPVEFLQRK